MSVNKNSPAWESSRRTERFLDLKWWYDWETMLRLTILVRVRWGFCVPTESVLVDCRCPIN